MSECILQGGNHADRGRKSRPTINGHGEMLNRDDEGALMAGPN
jgi:hypothetical protein